MTLTSNMIRNLQDLTTLAVFAFLLPATTTRAEVVAFWRFEPGALTEDSSGNGHTLLNQGVTEGTASPADGSTGSARFNGANIMHTVDLLDLSSYDRVKISWWQQVEDAFGEILFEHSVNMNSYKGGFFASANLQEPGRSAVTLRSNDDPPNLRYVIDNLFHETTNIWEKVAVEFTIAPETEGTDIVRIYKDDVLQEGTDRVIQSTNVGPFLSDFFFIGARAAPVDGAISFPLLGNLDEMMIEGFVTSTALAGDYNGDGAIDAADYTAWRDTMGSTDDLRADGDSSGTIDDNDYTVWKTNFGGGQAGAASLTSTSAIPEPATFILASVCALFLGTGRRRG